MNTGTFATTNSKGQLIIPKKMRDALNIDSHVTLSLQLVGGGIYIYPVQEFIAKVESESSYAQLLEKTKGAWKDEDWVGIREKRSSIELKASKTRKRPW